MLLGGTGVGFDSTLGEEPYKLRVGTGKMIRGVEQGIIGVCEHAEVDLVISPELAFGVKGPTTDELGVPGNATIKFKIEIVSVEPLAMVNFFSQMDINKDNR